MISRTRARRMPSGLRSTGAATGSCDTSPDARWVIEGAAGLGAPLAEQLRADQVAVTDVPARLARRGRLLSTGHGRRSDQADALSVGIAAWSAPALRTVRIDEAIAAPRAVANHRDDMVRARTQLINRHQMTVSRKSPCELTGVWSARCCLFQLGSDGDLRRFGRGDVDCFPGLWVATLPGRSRALLECKKAGDGQFLVAVSDDLARNLLECRKGVVCVGL